MPRGYQEAVKCLNTLQTNVAILEILRKQGMFSIQLLGSLEYSKSLPEMLQYAKRCGYSPADFDALNIIHVSGTKGKGSTCAIIDSILSQYQVSNSVTRCPRPFKTGLYTSPHLMEVRERIRINGRPISHDLFAKYFFEIWDKLEASRDSHVESKRNNLAGKVGSDMHSSSAWDKPGYFRYLTLLAFHVFKREKV